MNACPFCQGTGFVGVLDGYTLEILDCPWRLGMGTDPSSAVQAWNRAHAKPCPKCGARYSDLHKHLRERHRVRGINKRKGYQS